MNNYVNHHRKDPKTFIKIYWIFNVLFTSFKTFTNSFLLVVLWSQWIGFGGFLFYFSWEIINWKKKNSFTKTPSGLRTNMKIKNTYWCDHKNTIELFLFNPAQWCILVFVDKLFKKKCFFEQYGPLQAKQIYWELYLSWLRF